MVATTVLGSEPLSTAAIAWWRCGSKRSPGTGAIGAMRAFQEAGKRVPEDISIVGFDDIDFASFARPALTTVRQPLKKMGRIAAKTLLDWIEERAEYTPEIAIEPDLVIRNSTAPAPAPKKAGY